MSGRAKRSLLEAFLDHAHPEIRAGSLVIRSLRPFLITRVTMKINCVIGGLISISSIAYKLLQAKALLILPISQASVSMVAPTQGALCLAGGWMDG